MPTNVLMPQMGESIAEGTIVRWIKKVGDKVDRDEPLFEISTDKVDAEIPSPAAGVLTEIRAKEGDTIPVNEIVAIIGEAGSQPTAAPLQARSATSRFGASRAAAARNLGARGVGARVLGRRTGRGPAVIGAVSRGTAQAEVVAGRPAHRRRARRGHRPDPRHRHQRPRDQAGHPRVHRERAGGAARCRPRRRVRSRRPQPHPPRAPFPPAWGVKPGAQDEVVPMTIMRRRIAEHMVMSKRTSAHVHSVFEIDFSNVAKIREAHKADYERAGAKLTYLPFIVKAVVNGLKEVPIVNASVEATPSSTARPSTSGSRWRWTGA